VTATKHVHHTALWVRADDVEENLRFYCDGIGLELLMDIPVEGDWNHLFKVPYRRLRTIMLGDRSNVHGGVLELVVYDMPIEGAVEPTGRAELDERGAPRFLLVSFHTDHSEVLPRLIDLGYDDHSVVVTKVPAGDCKVVTLRDPNGFLVELSDRAVADILMEQALQLVLDAEASAPSPT
jgi:catechol 2,3-dioxygenase-like lactoylglutathione lyase family enzyme